MAKRTFEIQTYEVVLGRGLSLGGGAVRFAGYLVCRGKKKEDRLALYFLRDGDEAVPNAVNEETGWATCYLPANEMSWYVDILRNEHPVFVTLNTDRPDWIRVHTGPEPVGEAENIVQMDFA